MNGGKICVSVCAETPEEMVQLIRRAEQAADVVEVRFDCLSADNFDYENADRAQVVHRRITDSVDTSKLLTTFRSAEQGGNRDTSETARKNFWSSGFESRYADLEEDIIAESSDWFRGSRICSYHDFDGVPDDVETIYERLRQTRADIVKIAVSADDAVDGIAVWRLLDRARADGQAVIPIAMGQAGLWTRVLGLAHGAYLTYVSLDSSTQTAPGQVSLKDSTQLYRIKELDRETNVFGILGDPVSQSLSRFMHNPAFQSEGVNGVFIPFLVGDIDSFMKRMVRPDTREVELNFGGFSVTMPHKQSIMKHLDRLDETAAKIGAVNTIMIEEDGTLIGYNTDAHGFITPLKAEYGPLTDVKVAVLGAGGASRACIYALQSEGAKVDLFVRDTGKAEALGREFNLVVREISEFESRRENIDILVDATPIGMAGPLEQKTLFTSEQLKGIKFVYDLVTKPYDTPIVREARKAGISAIGGLEMLVAQGARQFEIWTGKKAPTGQMRGSVLDRFAELNQ